MNFLLGILEGGGSVDEHPLIQQLLDLFWLLMEVNMELQPPTRLGLPRGDREAQARL